MGGHWYWLTRVVPEKWPLNVCVLRIKSISTSLLCQLAASSYQDCKRLLHAELLLTDRQCGTVWQQPSLAIPR